MRTVLLIILLICVTLATAIASAPLGFFLGQAGLGQFGIGWAQAQGTVLNGRINGVFTAQQAIGDVRLSFRPSGLLSGGLAYDMDMGGAGLRGTGQLFLRPGSVRIDGLRLRQRVAALEGLDLPVRSIGGEIRVTDAMAVLGKTGCTQVSGRVTSDILSRSAAQYGKSFGPVSGDLGCKNGRITAALKSESQAGDTASFDLALDVAGGVDLTVRVTAGDPEIAAVMQRSGFVPEDGAWVYRFNSGAGGQ